MPVAAAIFLGDADDAFGFVDTIAFGAVSRHARALSLAAASPRQGSAFTDALCLCVVRHCPLSQPLPLIYDGYPQIIYLTTATHEPRQ